MIASRTKRTGAAAMLSLSLLATTSRAVGQGVRDENRAAAAEQLFVEGRRLLDSGAVEPACRHLQSSYELDPGLGTLLLLGHCLEELGKTASAWATFLKAASLATLRDQTERARIARVRAAALEPRLSRLAIELDSGQDASLLSVSRDGASIPAETAGIPVPVDPGKHSISVTSKGKRPFDVVVDVPPGPSVTSIRAPRLKPALERPAAPRANAASVSAEPLRALESGGSTQARAGYWVGAAGLAGAGVGTVFGLLARERYDASLDHCRTETLCTDRGLALRAQAETRATVATVAFVSAGALLGLGATLVWTAPSSAPDSERGEGGTHRVEWAPSIGPEHAAISVRSSW
jgi:hypothetical protein